MVVLTERSMLTTGHSQYLQPDYLSPLPTTLDAKKSPLALLAQTCSQIGVDSPSKPLITGLDKPSKGPSSARSPPAAKPERPRASPSDSAKHQSTGSGNNLAFKPYETNVIAKSRPTEESNSSSRPASKASSVHSASGPDSASNSAISVDEPAAAAAAAAAPKKSSSRSSPQGRKSASPAASQQHHRRTTPSPAEQRKSPADSGRDKASASPRNNGGGASPIIRSGMEILSGAKDAASLQSMYKAQGLAAFGAASSLCCPPGLAENPAFRAPFGGASPFSHHQAAAAALLGYPGAASASPYLSYARVKTPSGGETLVPVCKDPYCTGCPYSVHNAQLMMAAAAGAGSPTCPSGCTQCDHQKYNLMALSQQLGHMPPPPGMVGFPSHLAAGAAAAAAASKPLVCNWAVGDSYCGKRFASSEELHQHLRTHPSSDPSAAMFAGQSAHPLLSPSAALRAAAAAGTYPAPSLSPLGARYHPYGKPPAGPMPGSLGASPYSAFNALGPYYSPYAIYGQRIGAAVHH